MHDVPYREAVGVHWEAVKQIFRYLSGTRDLWWLT